MRILYFADVRFPLERANGIQTMETCHALGRRGHLVELVVRPDTETPARDPFEYYGLPPITSLIVERAPVAGPAAARRPGYLAFAVGRALGAARADAVLTRDLGVASLLLRLPGRLRPPVVYESHGYAPEVSAALPDLIATAARPSTAKLARLERRESRVWRDAEGYVTITAGLAGEMTTKFGPRAALAVVPDGARITASPDAGSTRRRGDPAEQGGRTGVEPATGLRPATGAPVVGYAGHLYAWKGVDLLLEALARLPGVHGLIVGGHEAEPDLQRLKDLADRLRIADRVTFTGLVPPSRVAALLAGADILVLPNPASAISTRFTSPLKLFEYMAAGRPIVASDLPSIREVLNDDNALLVPPGDPDALAGAVRRMIDHPGVAGRLATAAAAAVADYTWDRRAERLETLLQRVVRTRR